MLIQKSRMPIKEILSIGILPGFLKKWVYRLKGYKIGKNVSIGLGSVIIGRKVAIGDNTHIGFLTIIRGKQITIGSHVSIGATTFIDTPFIEIGDDSNLNEQVFIGGLQRPDSKFVLGRNSQIQQLCFINPALSVVIGDETSIGGHTLIFGHQSWHNRLEGYESSFAPIKIGNHVGLAWRVFVMPGASIGDGSLVGAHSLVNRAIPPKSMASGFPARVLSKAPDYPKVLSLEEEKKLFLSIIDEMIQFFSDSEISCIKGKDSYEIAHTKKSFMRIKKRRFFMKILSEPITAESDPVDGAGMDVIVSLKTIPSNIRANLNTHGTMWLDLEKKERTYWGNDLGDEVAQFLKRHGIRFFRVQPP